MSTEIQKYKYGRTFHLPWTAHKTTDDKIWDEDALVKAFSGKEIIITEKMDGECLWAKATVSLIDGTSLPIGKIVKDKMIGLDILGVDSDGQVVSGKVTNVFENGSIDVWTQIKIKGSHGSYRSLVCTPSHKIFIVGKGYVPVAEIEVGDEVLSVYDGLNVNKLQEQILLGKLLGDGSLAVAKSTSYENSEIALVQYTHKKEHQEYIDWCKKGLGDLDRGQTECVSGFGSEMIKTWTASSHHIYNLFKDMVDGDTKRVPEWVADKINPIGLAFWYMDDGSLEHSDAQQDRCQFSTCAFSDEDCAVLQRALQKFGVESTVGSSEGYNYIHLNYENAETFFLLVAPYIPPVMQYKLPEKFRGSSGWLPDPGKNENSQWLRPSVVMEIDRNYWSRWTGKYDIETTTHNYFANGALVHNCTTVYDDGSFHARSIDGRHHPSRNRMVGIAKGIGAKLPRGWRVCGENVYAQHSIAYTNLPDYFMVFGIYDENNMCLSWDDTEYFAEELGLTLVPRIWRGDWDHFYANHPDMTRFIMSNDWLSQNECGINGDIEGYVVRTVEGFHFDDLGSHCGKYVRSGHVQTDEHWMHKPVIPNELRND